MTPEPTDKWLEQINEEFSRRGVAHSKRPWEALTRWGGSTGTINRLDGKVAEKIFNWFAQNTKAGSQKIGPMYVGVFYYDTCFWPVFVPVVYGTVRLSPFDFLKTMPGIIIKRLMLDSKKCIEYVSVFIDCVDYAIGFDGRGELCQFANELLCSGDQQLNATVSLLLEDTPNPKAIESARMATEMFLKALGAEKAGLTEEDAKNKIRHDLEKALTICSPADTKSELKTILHRLSIFPGIGDRYKGAVRPGRELWAAYGVAQFVGTAVIRILTGVDMRDTVRVSYPQENSTP